MEVCSSIESMRKAVRIYRSEVSSESVGVVPTMGALHEGHLSLMRACRAECGFVVATIFVNPTQFGAGEDLDQYPRPLEDDLSLCKEVGVDAVFVPEVGEMYPEDAETFVSLTQIPTTLEGATRPEHFRGVATVVTKLFNIVLPDKAYFGQKDFQQQLLIRRMCRDLDIPIEIRTCPIVREADGLALSSRNVYLSDSERVAALVLSRALEKAASAFNGGNCSLSELEAIMEAEFEHEELAELDYAVIRDANSLEELSSPASEMVALIAARVGQTRLIDNRLLGTPSTS